MQQIKMMYLAIESNIIIQIEKKSRMFLELVFEPHIRGM